MEKEYRELLKYENCIENSEKSKAILSHQGYRELILGNSFGNNSDSSSESREEFIKKWINSPYESNPAYREKLKVPTLAGHMVRTKSESLVANILYLKNLPYRYEAPLKIGGVTKYPDFTILDPMTLKIWYYEHYGCMSIPSYLREFQNKTILYAENGIIEGINLICSFETDDIPIDVRYVENIIGFHFNLD